MATYSYRTKNLEINQAVKEFEDLKLEERQQLEKFGEAFGAKGVSWGTRHWHQSCLKFDSQPDTRLWRIMHPNGITEPRTVPNVGKSPGRDATPEQKAKRKADLAAARKELKALNELYQALKPRPVCYVTLWKRIGIPYSIFDDNVVFRLDSTVYIGSTRNLSEVPSLTEITTGEYEEKAEVYHNAKRK